MFKKTTFKNGLRIITVPQKGTQAVTVLVLVGTGSKYENKEINGISHFLEHMFFKGTKKRPTTLQVNEPLDRIGGIHNAFTGKEFTGYWAKVDFKHLDLALDWVSDIYLNSKFEEREINKERGVIIEEVNMYLDTPVAYVGELWEKVLYGDQPAGWLTIGEKEIIAKLKKEQFLNYLKNHYSAKNTIICIAGKIEPKIAIKKVKKYFEGMRKSPPKPKLKVIDASVGASTELSRMSSASIPSDSRGIEKQISPRSLVYFKKTDQTHFCLGARGYNLFHPKRYVQELLGIVLGGMMSSRLFIEIRDKLGLAYYIKTSVESNVDTGYLTTQAGVENNKADKAISIILKEYRKISQKKISAPELKKAKDNIKGKMILELESSDARASFYGVQELLKDEILTPKEIFKEVDKVSTNDILKVAKDIFQPKNLNLALIGPFENKRKFQELLKL